MVRVKVRAAAPPFTQNSVPLAPVKAPPAKLIVPFKLEKLAPVEPPAALKPPRTILTVGVPTPVSSTPPPVVLLIVIVLTLSVPTLLPAIARAVQLPILKPASVLLPGAPPKVTQLVAGVVLVVVGVGAAAVNNVMALTTRLTPDPSSCCPASTLN